MIEINMPLYKKCSLKKLSVLIFLCNLMVSPSTTASAQSSAPMPITLSQAIDLALKQNRSVKLARLAVTATENQKEIARASYFPHIRNESSILHITDLAGVEIPAGAFAHGAGTGVIPTQNLFIGQGSLTTYTSGTGLAQPLTQMFKIRQANRAATTDVNTAKVKEDQVQNEVAIKVRQLYYTILIAQLRQKAAIDDVAASESKERESAYSVEQGRSLQVASLESRAGLLESRQALLTHNLQIHNLKKR